MAQQIISAVLQRTATKIMELGIVTRREFGLEIIKNGLVALAADLYQQRRKEHAERN